MSFLLRGLKWPKTGLRENRVIVQFSDVYKHRPKSGWWPRTGGFTLLKITFSHKHQKYNLLKTKRKIMYRKT